MKIVSLTIEQPNNDPFRYYYDERLKQFTQTPFHFLAAARGYEGAYGWINETYQGPQKHLDAYYLTERTFGLGDIKKGFLCGALFRSNGDHKLIVVDYTIMDQMKKYELEALPKKWFMQLQYLFGNLSQEERWINSRQASDLLDYYLAKKEGRDFRIADTLMKDQLEELHKLATLY